MTTFARRKNSRQERPVLFVPSLAAAQREHLPEAAPTHAALSAPKARDWRTVRLRPEVTAVLDALLARSRQSRGEELTASEVFAALILAGLPKVTAQVPFRA